MNADRQAMIDGWKSPRRDRDGGRERDGERNSGRDFTAPRFDPSSRIAKPPRQPPARNHAALADAAGRYLTQDQQSEQFVADEDKFVLKQAKKKADIRVREQRAKPIDYLAFGLRFIDSDRDVFDDDDEDVDIRIPDPEAVLQGLDGARLEELEEDIRSYHTLEANPRNREYWTALLAMCADRRQKLKPQGPEGRAVTSVASDVDRILSPKTLEQLEALEKQIKAKLQSNEPIDTDYWEELLKSLLVYKAKAKLKKVCAAIKEARVELLRARDPEKAAALEASDGFSDEVPEFLPGATKPAARPVASNAGPPSSSSAPPPGTARFASAGNEDFSQATKALYDREVARGVGEGEEIFAAEETVPGAQKPLWAEKYRPRKPRYFNRVQMGYEWNKYNQTHYDHDNPPPKVVQGYRFNIFYPDLIDKTKAPTFKIVREHGRRKGESFAPAGKEDTCLIRFIAGPPYEDLAFRIVDREWDYSAKKERGFKSSFDKVRPEHVFCWPCCCAAPVWVDDRGGCICLGPSPRPAVILLPT